jgi:type I restriction enzyme, R subunit
MPTDTSEKSLETLIFEHLTTHGGYEPGHAAGFDPGYALDLPNLLRFLELTQPSTFTQLALGEPVTKRNQFFARLQGEITKNGVIHVLRKGIHHGPTHVDLFYGTPSESNPAAALHFSQNIFSITRQLHCSKDEARLSLDLCIFVNGLPILTFELKNSLTRQTYDDAIQQYKKDRDQRELLFQFGRCMAHFAVDDQQVWFCPN